MFFACDALVESDYYRAFQPDHRDNTIMARPNFNIKKDTRRESLFDKWVPALKEGGMTDEDIRGIFVDNPRRYFEGNSRHRADRHRAGRPVRLAVRRRLPSLGQGWQSAWRLPPSNGTAMYFPGGRAGHSERGCNQWQRKRECTAHG